MEAPQRQGLAFVVQVTRPVSGVTREEFRHQLLDGKSAPVWGQEEAVPEFAGSALSTQFWVFSPVCG